MKAGGNAQSPTQELPEITRKELVYCTSRQNSEVDIFQYRNRTLEEPGNVFTSTTELSGVRHTDSWDTTVPCTAGRKEVRGWLGVPQGDNVKLRHDEGSGAWETARGVLHRERESLGESGRSTSTASAGSSCSSTTEMEGSECTGVGLLNSGTGTAFSCVETVPSAWVTSESTSVTGEKQRETFTVSFLFWVDRGVPHWDFGACAGVWARVRRRWAGVGTG